LELTRPWLGCGCVAPSQGDIDVLNLALQLSYLEAAFYNQAAFGRAVRAASQLRRQRGWHRGPAVLTRCLVPAGA